MDLRDPFPYWVISPTIETHIYIHSRAETLEDAGELVHVAQQRWPERIIWIFNPYVGYCWTVDDGGDIHPVHPTTQGATSHDSPRELDSTA